MEKQIQEETTAWEVENVGDDDSHEIGKEEDYGTADARSRKTGKTKTHRGYLDHQR